MIENKYPNKCVEKNINLQTFCIKMHLFRTSYITQACTDFDVCIKLTVFEQSRPPDYENDFGFALSRLVFSQIVFS
jgi:hypothetical protein